MRAVALALALLVAAPAAAYADGWFGGCDENHDGMSDGCDDDPNTEGTQCKCSSSSHPASVGVWLGLAGIVAWRIGRKRRPR